MKPVFFLLEEKKFSSEEWSSEGYKELLSYRVLLQETVVTKEEKDLRAVSCSVTVMTLGILLNLFF